ncbi:thioredoxin family protein [Cohnella panacarvi]|uniref:thioredoxin family protein n=1 Tax=Cohnella panacarvi TaxID=400776 RepID=UPI00047EFA50|nr:thioredoxin family protein [Cohnella panacarvi]
MSKAVFYHAGCPVCVEAEQLILNFLDEKKVQPEIVHLGEQRNKITDAEKAGVKSVPAIVVDGLVYHINYGASLEDVKKG